MTVSARPARPPDPMPSVVTRNEVTASEAKKLTLVLPLWSVLTDGFQKMVSRKSVRGPRSRRVGGHREDADLGPLERPARLPLGGGPVLVSGLLLGLLVLAQDIGHLAAPPLPSAPRMRGGPGP